MKNSLPWKTHRRPQKTRRHRETCAATVKSSECQTLRRMVKKREYYPMLLFLIWNRIALMEEATWYPTESNQINQESNSKRIQRFMKLINISQIILAYNL
jgi:hypothetical protein